MLVDRSGRIWAMRPDNLSIALHAEHRQECHEAQAPSEGRWLGEGSFARVVDGVAVLPVYGALMRTRSFFFSSYQEIAEDLAMADRDAEVRGIVLDIDSPGGLVAGLGDLSAALRARRGDGSAKPVSVFVGGNCASAAFWLAASAGPIAIGSGTVLGSIGAVIEYIDLEPMFEKMGAKIVRFVASQSPNKRVEPDSDIGSAELQALVDDAGAEFVAAVAAGRGVSEAAVLERMGQGLVFAGPEAIERGMADRRATLSEIIAGMAGRESDVSAAPAAASAMEDPMEWDTVTAAGLREHRADLVETIEAAARAEAEAGQAAAIEAAVAAERQRIADIEAAALPGHEALVTAAKADPKATAGSLALQIVAAEKAKAGTHLEQRLAAEGEAGAVPPEASAGDLAGATPEARFAADPKLQAEFGGNVETYKAFLAAQGKGLVKIKSK